MPDMKLRTTFFLFFSLLSTLAFAEQKIVDGAYHIHYSVFPSTAISAKVAATYQLKRSRHRALINITPQLVEGEQISGVKGKLSGTARNLIGQSTQLEFREIIEGTVVYYVAELPFSNEDHFRFNLTFIPQDTLNKTISLKFEKKFPRE